MRSNRLIEVIQTLRPRALIFTIDSIVTVADLHFIAIVIGAEIHFTVSSSAGSALHLCLHDLPPNRIHILGNSSRCYHFVTPIHQQPNQSQDLRSAASHLPAIKYVSTKPFQPQCSIVVSLKKHLADARSCRQELTTGFPHYSRSLASLLLFAFC